VECLRALVMNAVYSAAWAQACLLNGVRSKTSNSTIRMTVFGVSTANPFSSEAKV